MIDNNSILPEGYKMTELGVLPLDWKVCILNKLVEKTKQKDPRKDNDRHFKYIDVSSIDRESLRIKDYKLLKGKDAPSRARKLVVKHDVIFATVRPTLKRLSYIDEEYNNEICSTAFCVLRATPDTTSALFLFFAIQRDYFFLELEKIQRGASYPAVSDSDIKSQIIPLPPLDEQKNIAAVLSSVQEAKDKTEAVISALKELKKSLMAHLFTYGPVSPEEAESITLKETEIGMVPEEWEVESLINIATLQRGKDLAKDKWIDGQYPIVGSSGIIGYHNKMVCSAPGVVTGRSGSIGNVTYVESNYWPHNTGLYIKNFHGNNPKFIYYLLCRLGLKKYASGVSVPTLNRNTVHNVLLPKPPLPVQQKIADILSSVDEKIEAEENKKKALEELFKTMLEKLMTGQIRVNSMEID